MSKKTSLKQFLMKAGRFGKVSECVSAIKNGEVSIGNEIIRSPNHYFNPKKSILRFHHDKIKKIKKLYFILNKPAGYVCQKTSREKNIYELIGKFGISSGEKLSLFAVGRLDKGTEGLMIITNDGELSLLISDPQNRVKKEYFAALEKPITKENARYLENGIDIRLDEGFYRTKECKIKIIRSREIYILISEGKKRQIRRMFEAVGNKVVYLRRVSIGRLYLGDLEKGGFRQLEREDILEKIFNITIKIPE
jgi:16S rRNA pseudouridine516 synthase